MITETIYEREDIEDLFKELDCIFYDKKYDIYELANMICEYSIYKDSSQGCYEDNNYFIREVSKDTIKIFKEIKEELEKAIKTIEENIEHRARQNY